MSLTICEHVKLGGGRCGSPAMRGQHYCYFHAPGHRVIPSLNLPGLESGRGTRIPRRGQARPSDPVPWQRCKLQGEALELQIALSRFIQGVARGVLNVRQAKIILKALQGAMANLRDGTATDFAMNRAAHPPRISDSPCNIQSLNDYNRRALPLSTSSSATGGSLRADEGDRKIKSERVEGHGFSPA